MTNHQIRSWLLLDPCCLSVGQPCLKKAPHHLSQHISIKLKRNHGINHSFSPQESRKALCTTIIGYVSDTQTDLQSPVQFSLSYSLVQVDAPSYHCTNIIIIITTIITIFTNSSQVETGGPVGLLQHRPTAPSRQQPADSQPAAGTRSH